MVKRIIQITDKEIKVPAGTEVLLWEVIAPSERGEKIPARRKFLIAEDCVVEHIVIVRGATKKAIKQTRRLELGRGSRLRSYEIFLGAAKLDWTSSSRLADRADFSKQVLFYQSATDELHVQDNYIFAGLGARGQFAVSGVLSGAARARYFSDLAIKAGAQKTEMRIDLKLFLLSPGAQGSLLPGLKIAANDVKAGHSASTFRLSAEELFYLSSRGLREEQIKSLVIRSLADNFTSHLSAAASRQEVAKIFAAYFKQSQ